MKQNSLGSCIFPLIESLDDFKKLEAGYKDGGVINISGLDEAGATAIIAALRSIVSNPFLVISENEIIGRYLTEDFNQLGISAKLLPSLELSFLKTDAASRDISLQRLATLGAYVNGDIDVLIVPADALLNRVMARARFESNVIRVKDTDVIKPGELISRLTEAGYERLEIVESRGQCSLRGGILDVYPIGAPNAVRIEFFDDEVDSLREFDVLTQRSLDHIHEIAIYPAREVLLSHEEALAAADRIEGMLSQDDEREKLDRQRHIEHEFNLLPYEEFFELTSDNQSAEATAQDAPDETQDKAQEGQKAKAKIDRRYKSLIDALRNDRSPDMSNSLINILAPDSQSVIEFANEATIVIQHSDRVRERCKGVYDDFLLSCKAAFERGEALKAQSELLLTYDELRVEIKSHTVITVDSFLKTQNDYTPTALAKFEYVGTPGYNSNMKEIAAEIRRLQAQKAYIVLLAGGSARSQRLTKLLNEEELIVPALEAMPKQLEKAAPVILPSNLSNGFILRSLPLYVFSEMDIFGRGKQRKRTATSAENKTSVFTQLKVGDYVVHENHGIGQYLGTVRMNVDGTLRDFLNIRYGGTDKLYVPTDQMDRIQKYIGSEGEVPKLNHLSGGDWQKQKAKVRRAIKEIAGDLIKLYAARSASPGYAFGPDTPWQKEFEDSFPFEETPDQAKAITEIKSDMERPMVMDRLLCGDVGYGKTEVAMRAVFKCVMDGKQAVLLAPTTILVQQHYATALNRFANFPVNIDTLSRFKTPAEQKEVIQKLKTGEIDFVIGTHRLLSKEIQYKDLGLLVVDEEQRFGVGHKEAIKQYKKNVDVLTLSATPIPRTLHMSMVGIRDMSILKTPPDERYPIQTYVVEYSDGLVRDAILRELSRGGQVYVLHNRVQTIEMVYNRLKKLVPEAR
ncbi:MAG: DEAD/DEAH box helicase, partial [Clostridia bacterium]|nr:DEAD/DEAH box helicase [Clostridia bacterium]